LKNIKTRIGVDVENCKAFSYHELRRLKTKAFRNGNWWRLERIEKGLFNATLALAKIRNRIINPSLVEQIRMVAMRMLETITNLWLKKGREKAKQLEDLYSRNGVFDWLPKMKDVLRDRDYLVWLGLSTMNYETV